MQIPDIFLNISAILLLVEMTCGILGFIFKDWIKAQATSGFQAFIVHYRYSRRSIVHRLLGLFIVLYPVLWIRIRMDLL
jgi:hypothetical protein